MNLEIIEVTVPELGGIFFFKGGQQFTDGYVRKIQELESNIVNRP